MAEPKDQEAPEDSDGLINKKESPKRLCTEANQVSTNQQDSTIEPQSESKAETGSSIQETPKTQVPEPRKAEAGIKIRVGDEQKNDAKEERPEGIADEYNPYLYDCSGPKKVIDYSKQDDYEEAMEALSFGTYEQAQVAFTQDGGYAVNYNKEKFAIKKQESLSAEDKEAKELEEALEQIRAMEENAKMQVPQSNQLLEYLKRGDYVYELFAVLIHSGGA